jgi:hypothetical protein
VTRLRERNADLEDRARRHTARIEELEDAEAMLRRRIRVLEVELRAQAAIIRRRNGQVAVLGEGVRRLLLAYCALARIRPEYAPAPRVVDTGTPGVKVSR